MELVFLAVLLGLMIFALTSGFPVAFALPGAAIGAVGLAALTGFLFAGDSAAFFAQDGPVQWLSAGVTNFRSLYWLVERDTLIAIPLFIFMGIMLQRSKIAEDLLVAMAQLFGPLPGGLGISVVFVGALLAATTGIVGATVIAMGLISLPAMLRNNYSKSLATGTICASGTLGQIIPPSIVLIILADQLSSAADQANTARKELYRATTGEFSMPSQFEVVSASAGDMFMGALIPGIILVGIYMLYILIVAWIKPEMAPPVPYDGEYDAKFARAVLLALVPPLSLIFIVLGSILLGVATVNQAGSIGAVGAIIMAGYRLTPPSKLRYFPSIMALLAIVIIASQLAMHDLNIKNLHTDEQRLGVKIAGAGVALLLLSVFWSSWRVFRIKNTLREVMTETAKTTSMVFIILIGAAMLTSAFRAFGGEELVQHFLTSLPGGFWTQFIVVMFVIFLLGFFLDFIEIAVVVVPIVAPILLMNPEANITAVWLGVMIGLNIQTSFLTPPFGFALFYLRGVADKVVKTVDIYKGATAFIALQLLALAIAGLFPSLVNYLPNRSYLTSDTAPPPINPKIQLCVEDYIDKELSKNGDAVKAAIQTASALDISFLPKTQQQAFNESTTAAMRSFSLIDDIDAARDERLAYAEDYAPLHKQVRTLQSQVKRLAGSNEKIETEINDLNFVEGDHSAEKDELRSHIADNEAEMERLTASIPAEWDKRHGEFKTLNQNLKKTRGQFTSTVDGAYQQLQTLQETIGASDALSNVQTELTQLVTKLEGLDSKAAQETIKSVENQFGDIAGASKIKSALYKARRAYRKADASDPVVQQKVDEQLRKATDLFTTEVTWRAEAKDKLLPALQTYDSAIAGTLGLRSQELLNPSQAKAVARCQSSHRDISLFF